MIVVVVMYVDGVSEDIINCLHSKPWSRIDTVLDNVSWITKSMVFKNQYSNIFSEYKSEIFIHEVYKGKIYPIQ